MSVRTLEPDEAVWAAELMQRRREIYAGYSPVFWRPRSGVLDWHAEFLRRRIEASRTVALRTDQGFIIAEHRRHDDGDDEGPVDDFAVAADDAWATDGSDLLQAAWRRLDDRGVRVVRVVTAQADHAKVAMLRRAGLQLSSQWWVKPVGCAGQAAESGRVEGSGFSGVLGSAPPVYDPGGPVLLADHLDPAVELTTLEREARDLGAVLVVLPTPPDDQREQQFRRCSWSVASQWFVGQPHDVTPVSSTRRYVLRDACTASAASTSTAPARYAR